MFTHFLMAQQNFDIQGHRGARGLMPENTVPAFMEALRLGVNTLEMDVVISKDGQAVVSHEPFFNHEISLTPFGKEIEEKNEKNHNLYQMNYEEIARYDVGKKTHPRFLRQQKITVCKPLLSEVIDSAELFLAKNPLPFTVFYNIETKTTPASDGIFHPTPEVFVQQLLAVIDQKKIQNRVTIQSFDVRTLQIVHKIRPELKLVLLVENTESFEKNLEKLGFAPNIYSPYFELVNPELVKKCHKKDILLIPWTVNDASKMKELKNLGVDGLISDYPDIAIQTLR